MRYESEAIIFHSLGNSTPKATRGGEHIEFAATFCANGIPLYPTSTVGNPPH